MSEAGVATETRIEIKEPSMYKVIFLNDDYTPMDFVVAVLMQIFNKKMREANEITMAIHNNGKGVVGSYIHQIAITKANETIAQAKAHGYPLKVVVQEA